MRSCCVFLGLLLTRRDWERCWQRSGNSFTSILIAIHGESSPPVHFPGLPLTLSLLAWNFHPPRQTGAKFQPFINTHYLIGQAERWPRSGRGFWEVLWHFGVAFVVFFFFHFASLDTILFAKIQTLQISANPNRSPAKIWFLPGLVAKSFLISLRTHLDPLPC